MTNKNVSGNFDIWRPFIWAAVTAKNTGIINGL